MGEADDLTNAPVVALNLIDENTVRIRVFRCGLNQFRNIAIIHSKMNALITKLVIDLLFCVLMGTII